MAVATRFEVARSGGRGSVVVSPSSLPDLKAPLARPQRRVAAGRVSRASSCASVVAPARQASPLALRVKVVAVGLVAVFGVAMSAPQFVAMAQPDPSREYVAGHPAWAHVDNP